jgi:ribonuclease HI
MQEIGINEGIGAAMYCHTDRHTQQRYLGTSPESMVYAGELEAIFMAVTYARRLTQMQSLIFLKSRTFTDSQVAMRSLAKPKQQSGQGIIKQILDQIDKIYLTVLSYSMQFDWGPGHVGIARNKMADQAVKGAAIEKINPSLHQLSSNRREQTRYIKQSNRDIKINGSTARERRSICKTSRNGT